MVIRRVTVSCYPHRTTGPPDPGLPEVAPLLIDGLPGFRAINPRPMPSRTAALISLGCSKNLADSEDLITALRSVDFGLTKELG